MKKYPFQLLLLILFINIATLFSTEIFAASQPPDPGGDPTGGGDPVGGDAPIGNGVWFLISLAVTYLLWKTRKILSKDLLFSENSK